MRRIVEWLSALGVGLVIAIIVATTGKHHLVTILFVALAATLAALVAVTIMDKKRSALASGGKWLIAKNPIAVRNPFMRRGSTVHRTHMRAQKGFDYRVGLEMGRLLEQADPTSERRERETKGKALIARAHQVKVLVDTSDEKVAMILYDQLHKLSVIRELDSLKNSGDYRPTPHDLLNRFYNNPGDTDQLRAMADRLELLGEDLSRGS